MQDPSLGSNDDPRPRRRPSPEVPRYALVRFVAFWLAIGVIASLVIVLAIKLA